MLDLVSTSTVLEFHQRLRLPHAAYRDVVLVTAISVCVRVLVVDEVIDSVEIVVLVTKTVVVATGNELTTIVVVKVWVCTPGDAEIVLNRVEVKVAVLSHPR